MSFFRHHRHGDNENRKDENPPVYSQPPAGYSQPPPSCTQPPHSYTQPPPSYTQHPPAYSHPQPGYSAPPPAAYSQQPYPPTYTQHPPPYSQQPPAYTPAAPAASGSYAGSNNATVRVYTKAGENYSLSIRDGAVVLAPTNPRDELQHWYKDFRWATQVKDDENLPGFALINKATGLAIKHSLGPTHPVRLVPYNPDYLDESVLWTESHETGEGFRAIRMVNNTRLNFDAFHGDKKHGGVHDGTTIVLWEWAKGNNQQWKIVPYYCKFSRAHAPSKYRIFAKCAYN
ncbi:hypothetical protein KSP39_PZI017615 [Platanthera zijinensis]|uniref:Hydroxyproline-rich glycoprotein family protein n=1 Tax=Platanthera zijinensis TaxID=2320716 RepID=A0AAP0G059_9ASPA